MAKRPVDPCEWDIACEALRIKLPRVVEVERGGVLEKGGAQDVYFCEFDGPARREILVIVEGE